MFPAAVLADKIVYLCSCQHYKPSHAEISANFIGRRHRTRAGCSRLRTDQFTNVCTDGFGGYLSPASDSLDVVQLQLMHSSVILQRVATAEQRSLYRLATELRFVLNLVRESQAQADPDARIRFDYGLLIRDLRNMIAGIEAHAVPSSASLDSIEPIPGDYLR